MKRLKEPFGKAGLTVAILALVLAMVGGAYAAGGLTKPQEKQVTKIAKKFAGKPGANGTAGTNGTAGAKGDKGEKGDTGNNGTSVASSAVGAGGDAGHCVTVGGSKFVAGASTTYACNGKDGTFGTEPLPPGQTLTGVWGFGPLPTESGVVGPVALVSFPIPLSSEPTAHYISHLTGTNGFGLETHFEEPSTEQTVCPGTTGEGPTAEPGNLCVYETTLTHAEAFTEGILPGKVGVFAEFAVTGTEPVGLGTWAVTAE